MEIMPDELVYEAHRRFFDVFLNPVKREMAISRDPFSIGGLTDEFAFALMGEGDELCLAYKDLNDGEDFG